ncbi:MAG: efflux RND transporter permease subunit [Leptothrix ochracea]|uniref:efflux RND transporter permease subunit n=1 Tax=Leptothrix ochracea TaxID=735331 RepID=UPI0034E2C42B
MIKALVSSALRQPLFVIMGLILFIGGGVIAFNNLPVEAFPDISDTQVQVITLYPGHAAEEVEKQVTMPIETALSGVPHAVRVFSHTQFGLSYMAITFSDKADDYFARAQITERLRDADLPDGVKPSLGPLSSAIGEIFRYRIKGDHLSSTQLRELQDWVMERQLKTVPGVADVVSFGGLIKTYEVQPDLGRLRDHRLSVSQLANAVSRGNANAGGGSVEQGRQQYLIRGIGLLRSAADLENIVVAESNGVPVLVRDVAKVAISAVPRQGVAGQDADDDIVYGLVLMRKGENASVVLDGVKAKIEAIKQSSLPAGVSIAPFYDRSWLIDKTLHTVFGNLLEGALLVALVLYLFLSNLRAAAIVAMVIPLSLLATFIGLKLIGIPANLLSLGAMDFGIIVDGAVIIVEHIVHQLSLVPKTPSPGATAAEEHESRLRTVLNATIDVGRPTLFSMLIIIAAHIPIFTLQRHEGRIFAPMAYSVTSALIGSLIVSLTLVPLLSLKFLRGPMPHGDNWLMRWAKATYLPALQWALGHKRIVLGVAGLALTASMVGATHLGSEFLPELNEGSIWLNASLEPSVSITEAQSQVRRIREIVRSVPEVHTVISKLGRPEDGSDPKIASQVEALIDLSPEEQWKKGRTKAQILADIDSQLDTIPGIQTSFGQPIRDNVLESISQIDAQVVVKITGDDLEKLQVYGHTVLDSVQKVAGVSRAFIDRNGQLPQFRIEIDRARAARYGLNVGDVEDVIESALGGKNTTTVWEGERRFDVTIRLGPDDRSPHRIRSLLIPTTNGAQVPLADIAEFRHVSGAMNIARENGQRVISIGVFIQGRDMGSVVADMQTQVQSKLKLETGYVLTWSGEFENQQRAMKRLSWVVPLSILLIFMLLFDAFKSLKTASLIIANIPFALIGGIVALLITDIPLSVSAAIGFIALFGQAVLNGVVMLSHFNDLRRKGRSVEEAVVEGSLDRLRTVLMTALLAMLGLLPMALSHAIGSETQRPLAVVVIGGLISATLLTLLVLPTLYVMTHRKREPKV